MEKASVDLCVCVCVWHCHCVCVRVLRTHLYFSIRFFFFVAIVVVVVVLITNHFDGLQNNQSHSSMKRIWFSIWFFFSAKKVNLDVISFPENRKKIKREINFNEKPKLIRFEFDVITVLPTMWETHLVYCHRYAILPM